MDPFRELFDLTGRAYVVAGAGMGMGEATARAIHAFGGRLVCVDREPERAAQVAAAVGGVPAVGDVTDEAFVLELLDLAERELGPLDGIVDIVGGARFVSIRDLETADWESEFTTNLRHAYLLGRHGGVRLADGGRGGSMVFIASNAAWFGSRAFPAYSTAKLALTGWVRSLAEEFGPSGVRANAVAPGATLTDRMAAAWDDEAIAAMARPTVRGRLGSTAEIAGTIVYLLSDAAGNTTGQTITVDGGTSIRDPVYGGGDNPAEAAQRRVQRPR